MHVWEYIHIFVYLCTYENIYIYLYIYARMRVYIYIYIYICTYEYMYIYMRVWVYINIHIQLWVYIYIYIYIYIYMHVWVYVYYIYIYVYIYIYITCRYIYIYIYECMYRYLCAYTGWLVYWLVVSRHSALVGYSMPNPIYIFIHTYLASLKNYLSYPKSVIFNETNLAPQYLYSLYLIQIVSSI